jgi:hypothetical protein
MDDHFTAFSPKFCDPFRDMQIGAQDCFVLFGQKNDLIFHDVPPENGTIFDTT